jgi:hypothetical protein
MRRAMDCQRSLPSVAQEANWKASCNIQRNAAVGFDPKRVNADQIVDKFGALTVPGNRRNGLG